MLCFGALLAYTMSSYAYAPILPLIKSDLQLSYTGAGMIASAYFIGYAIAQIPWGLAVDRHGGRRVIAASVFGAGVSTYLFGLSTTGEMASVLRFICGLSAAGVFVPSIRVISGWFPQRSRGTALGVLGVGASMSVPLLGFASPYLATHIGWRWAISFLASFSMVYSIVIWLALRDPPRRSHESSQQREHTSFREIVSERGFWILGCAQFVRYGIHNTLLAWIALYLVEFFGLPLWLAGATISSIFMITMISDPAGGFASDRIGRIPVIFASLTALSGLLVSLALNKDLIVVWLLLAGVGWVLTFYRGPLFALIPERYGITKTGLVTGVHNTFAATGGFVVSLVFGYLRDASGEFVLGFMVAASLSLLAALLLVALPKAGSVTS